MKKHTFTVIFLILAVSLSVFAKGTPETSENEDLRIVTLAPNMTELVYYLGAGESLVGRSSSCQFPSDCLSVPDVGDMWKPDLEKILTLEPTVVLASSLTDDTCITAMKNAGLNVFKINYDQRLEGTYNLINEVGKAIDKEEEAKELSDNVRNKIQNLINKTSSVYPKKSVIYIISWGDWGDFAATGDTFIGDIIEACGGINAAKDGAFWSVSKELILAEDPDVIILPSYSYQAADIEGFKSTAPYSQLNGSVITLDGDSAERQGVRTADFAQELASILYPELF